MPLTLTCPSCGQQCAVKEEYAGMQVRCPRCPGVITVPLPAQAVIEAEPILAEPVAALPVGGAAPPLIPAAPAGPGFIDNIAKLLAANGLTGVNQILLLVGMGCLALFLITVLFPWYQGFPFTILGITFPVGIIQFLLVLAILFLLVFSVMLGWTRLFEYSLWSASNLSIICALHLVAMLRGAAWGLFISFIVMLAAAATIGVVAFSKVFGSPPR
ncbi:MAG: hypothetical protein L0Y71_20290 [Gemmataceae bacterium]|nr:hypothetical protein [Gemmataceae bacterium]